MKFAFIAATRRAFVGGEDDDRGAPGDEESDRGGGGLLEKDMESNGDVGEEDRGESSEPCA